MNIRNEYLLTNQEFFHWLDGQPPALNFSWEAYVSRMREQLAEFIKHSGLFDTKTIETFNQSRQSDGTYKINAGDSTLINITKCLISLLTTVENMNPPLISSMSNYMQSNSWLTTSINYVSFLGNYLYQRSRLITEFKFHSRNLSYYLSRFKSEAGALSTVNHALLDSTLDLYGAISKNLQPFIKHIRVMQLLPEEDNDAPQLEHEPAPPVTVTASATNNTPLNSKTLSIATKAVCGSIDDLKKRLDALLQTKSDTITSDPLTGVYKEDSTDDPTAQNLLHAANIMSRFKAALLKVERTVNHHELHVLDVCQDLGQALKELQSINIESIKQITAVELQVLIKLILSGIEPIMVEMALFLDIVNSRFDINNPAIQENFDCLYQSYKKFTDAMGITLKHTYPYWEERLTVRQRELQQKEEARNKIIKAIVLVQQTEISEQTSLPELLAARKAARVISSPNMYYYEKEINRLIYSRTGMSQLAADITKLENQARTTTGESQTTALKKLPALYVCRSDIEARLEHISAGNNMVSHFFSYNKEKKCIDMHSIPTSWYANVVSISARRISSPKASTLETGKQILSGLDRDCEKLQHLMTEAAEHVIALSEISSNEKVDALVALKNKIDAITPLSFYSMPIPELRQLYDHIKLLRHPDASGYEGILKHALEDRVGVTALKNMSDALEAAIAQTRALEESLQYKIDHLKFENPDWEHTESISTALLKQANILKLYRDLIEKKLTAEHSSEPDRKTIANIANKLDITPAQTLTLFAANDEWSDETDSYVQPLLAKMDERISALEHSATFMTLNRNHIDDFTAQLATCKTKRAQLFQELKQTITTIIARKDQIAENIALDTLPAHPYLGQDLDKLKNETSTLSRLLRKSLYQVAAYHILTIREYRPGKPTKSINAVKPAENERSDEENLQRIIKRYKGDLIVKSEWVREKILSYSMRFLTPEQQENFTSTKLSSGIFRINITDPVLVKNIKSLLNTIRRCEEATIRILPHLRNIAAGKGHIPCAFYGLPTTHEAVLELQVELKDFLFHLDQLQTAFPHLLNMIDLPAVKKIHALAAIGLTGFKDMLTMPEVASVMKINLTSQIEQVLCAINALAQTSSETKYDIAFAPLQSTIQALDDYIYSRHQLERGKNGSFKTKEAGEDRDLKDLLTVANTMSALLKTLHGLVNIADTKRLTDIFSLASRSFDIYRKVMHLYKTRLPEIKAGLKTLIEMIHPFLVDTAANTELVEIKFGLAAGQISSKIDPLYRKLEKAATKIGVTFTSNYPYSYEKLEVLTTELETDKHILDAFSRLRRIFSTNDSFALNISHYTLFDLVKLREYLRFLPPSATNHLLSQIEYAIARRTGLSGIEESVSAGKKSLAERDYQQAKLEKTAAGIKNEIDLLQQQKLRLNHYRAALQTPALQSNEDIYQFHQLYNAQHPLSFAIFCQLLLDKSIQLDSFLQQSLQQNDIQQEARQQELNKLQSRHQALASSYSQQQIQLEQNEILATSLHKRITAVAHNPAVVMEFTCQNGKIIDHIYIPYTAGLIDYKHELPTIIEEYYRFYSEKVDSA